MNKGNKKQTTITVRCSEKEKNEIDYRAKENNMTSSAYLRTRGITSDRKFNKSVLQKRIAKELCELQSETNLISKKLCNEEKSLLLERMNNIWKCL